MKRKLRLLLVEDSDEDAFLLLRELKRTYDIDHRQICTREAMQAALDEHWDVVISDWSMPEFSGLEAFVSSELHAFPADVHLRAIPQGFAVEARIPFRIR